MAKQDFRANGRPHLSVRFDQLPKHLPGVGPAGESPVDQFDGVAPADPLFHPEYGVLG